MTCPTPEIPRKSKPDVRKEGSNVPFYLISLIYLTGGLVAVGDRGQASIRFFGYSALFYLLGIEIGVFAWLVAQRLGGLSG